MPTEFKKPRLKAIPKPGRRSHGPAPVVQISETGISPAAISWTIKALLIAVFLLGAGLRIANLGNVVSRSPDEQTYRAQATAIAKDGLAGNRTFANAYLHNPVLHSYPPPTRVGFTALVAAAIKLTGAADEHSGAYVSLAASLLSLLACMSIGLRFFTPWVAVLSGAFFAVFPPELVMARRCWPDALVGLVGILMFYFTMELFSGRRRWFFYVPLAVVGSASVMIKETSVLVYAPCLIVALWAFVGSKRDFACAARVIAAALVCGLMTVALLAYATGGIQVPLTILSTGAQANTTNTYALQYQSGPGYLLLWAFQALSPITFLLALLGMGIAIVKHRRSGRGIALLAWLTIGYLAVFMIIPAWLNLRYVSAAFVPLCVFAGFAVWHLLSEARRRLSSFTCQVLAALALAAIALMLYTDYQRFDKVFVQANSKDLSIGLIRQATSN